MSGHLSPTDFALLRGYQILCRETQSLFGYPVAVTRPSAESLPLFRTESSGNLHYALAGRNQDTAAELVLPAEARTDEFATSLANSFAKACRRMQHHVQKPGDVGLYFVRFNKYVYDNLTVTRTHSTGKKLYVLDTLMALRDALTYRYEGSSVDVGIILTWDWPRLEALLQNAGCTVLEFSEGFNLRSRLQLAKASYLMADGVTSFYVATPEDHIARLVVMPARIVTEPSPKWQLVPREYRYIDAFVKGRDVFLNANRRGELWLFTKRTAVKWSVNRWHRVSAPPLTDVISQYLPRECATRIVEVIVTLSTHRVGALLAIGPGVAKLGENGSPGIRAQFATSWNPSITEISSEFLARLSGIDGATLIGPDGALMNAGVILRVPEHSKTSGEGARTAAAAYASTFGLAIKVSHDGPITVFENGVVRFQAA